jgi:prephenate dehydratase
MKIAYQGEPGAYSEAALLAYFGDQSSPVACRTFEAVFGAVEAGNCDYGMLPIENSLAGSIHHNYDLLLAHNLHIVGEYFLAVQHCLVALPGVTLQDIHKIISHPQALAQCSQFLSSLPWVISEAAYDTAGSVRMIREQGDPQIAAIASYRAAVVHGLPILAERIEDHPANYTRFLAVAPDPIMTSGEAKTSIVFTLRNQPGTLFKALGVFALRDIDLYKIESRPLIGQPWEYLFYIDFAGHADDITCRRALEHLQEMALLYRLLGSYTRHCFNDLQEPH